MTDIITGKLKITYSNGTAQKFNILSKTYYDTLGVPVDDKETINEAKERRSKKLKQYEPWCLEGSPIHLALNTNKLILPETQGGIHDVNCVLID